jgi:dihydrolipoamide dehydrogenase
LRTMTSQREVSVKVAVIGAGTAGLAAYRAAAARADQVVLVEGGPLGTTCARVGCMPSKLLIAAAEAAHHARGAAPFGVNATIAIDGRAVMDRVRRERDRFVGFVVESVERIPEEHVLRGTARFVSPSVIEVGDVRVRADAFVIATGSSPVIPAMFDSVRDRIVLNDHVFDWDELPRSVAVFGAGVVGLELGQALHRLGVRTRIFGRSGTVGPLTDPEVIAVARDVFASELAVDFDATVRQVSPRAAGGVEVVFESDGNVMTEEFDALLVAAGRRPNLTKLGLENAGVDLAAPIDRRTLRWGTSHIFVAGDASDDLPLLHEAADEGAIAGANAASLPEVADGQRRSPMGIAFSDPQLGLAGATFAELTGSGTPFVVGTVSFADQGRSRVMLQNRGLLRIYADPASGRLLGAEMAGPRAEHLAHLLAWSHQQGLTVGAMLQMPFYHPVVEEGLRTALRDASAKLARIQPQGK